MKKKAGPLQYFFLLLIMGWTLLPFLWLLISSFSPHEELISSPPHWIPRAPTLQNFREVLDLASPVGRKFLLGLKTSATVAVTVSLISLIFGSLAAYGLARIPFRGKDPLVLSLVAIRMLPSIALVLPLYLLVIKLHRIIPLFDTWWNLAIIYNSFILGFVIWIMRGYFLTIPKDLEEAAEIDGCTRMQAFLKVLLPLSAPGLVATGIFAFLMSWDEFLFALIFSRTAAVTAPLAIAELGSQYVTAYESIAATGFLASLPPVLLALLFQKYIVSGLTGGGVKE